jgi:hypothetical protein
MTTGHLVEKIFPERDIKLSAGFLKADKSVSAATSNIATGGTADLAFFDVLTDVSLTQVVM